MMSKAIETLREHFNQKPVPNSKVLMEERDTVNTLIDAVEEENGILRELVADMLNAWDDVQRETVTGPTFDECEVRAYKMGIEL